MKWFFSRCKRHCQSICLLAGGVLPERERALVESHLAACAGCQKYYDEVKSVVASLANWEKNLLYIEPNQVVQARWAKEFQTPTRLTRQPLAALVLSFLDWCRDMVWPCRRVWTGFAAVWLVVLVSDLSTRDATQSRPTKSSRPSPQMLRAFLEGEGVVAEWTKAGKAQMAEPLKASHPSPRSEQPPGILHG